MEELQQHLESLMDEIIQYQSLNEKYSNLISMIKKYENIRVENLETINDLVSTIYKSNKALDIKITKWRKIVSENNEMQELLLEDFDRKLSNTTKDYDKKIKELDLAIERIISNKFNGIENMIKESNALFRKGIIRAFYTIIGIIFLFGILISIFIVLLN